MSALPLILAGPIVRRVELGRASVWVALSAPAEVTLKVHEGRVKSANPGDVIAEGTAKTWRCAERLHIALIETGATIAKPWSKDELAPKLSPLTIYSYDVVVKPEGGQPQTLADQGLLKDDPADAAGPRMVAGVAQDAARHLALGYEEDFLPGFVTPAANIADVKVAQASCRKMHGPGTDAMDYLDDAIEKAIDDPARRVQQLYLTGDQIYADDVPTSGLPILHDLAMALATRDAQDEAEGEEELPVEGGHLQRVNMATAPPLCRGAIVRGDAGFTTTGATNHLLTFGEYAALYLMHWSPRVWRPPADDDRVLKHADIADPDAVSSLFTRTRLGPLMAAKGQPALHGAALRDALKRRFGEDFERERQRIMAFAASVGKVARTLANTPTYMLFDDHDVTDDWNINGAFMTRVYRRACGRAVVRNGLLAYTFFQGIGNDWQSFAAEGEDAGASANKEFLAAATDYLSATRGRSATAAGTLERLFGFPGTSGDRMDFHYGVPALCYEVRVLDSRTRRKFEGETSLKAAHLLGESLSRQVPAKPRLGRDFLLVVTSTPVLMPDLFERLAQPLLIANGDRRPLGSDFAGQSDFGGEATSPESLVKRRTAGALDFDKETWGANIVSLNALLDRLVPHHPVVMLGGDVHFGANLMMDRWLRNDEQPPTVDAARLVQLTSSAARNAFHKQVEGLASSIHWINQMIFGPTIAMLGWKKGGKVEPAGEVSLHRTMMLTEKPAYVPGWGWPTGAGFGDKPPDMWSDTTTIGDARPDTARGGAIGEAAGLMEGAVQAMVAMPRGLERSRHVAGFHAATLTSKFAPQRSIVFGNNVGILGFERVGADGVAVVHTLLSSRELGYPEDVADVAALADLPFGRGAELSRGNENTVIRVVLDKPDEARAPTLEPADA